MCEGGRGDCGRGEKWGFASGLGMVVLRIMRSSRRSAFSSPMPAQLRAPSKALVRPLIPSLLSLSRAVAPPPTIS
eukprot:1196427-Prorocentrum_minimum.AAC.3